MSTELVVLQDLTPLAVFANPQTADAIIEKIKAEAATVGNDISTEAGRDAIRSMAYKIARSKTALDEMGKSLTEEARAKIDTINTERRRLKEEMEKLQEDVRRPLTDWENAEKIRTAAREDRLAEIQGLRFSGTKWATAECERRIAKLEELAVFEWQEFNARAEKLTNEVRVELTNALEARRKYEADQAELARLRQEEEERRRREHEEKIAREAAEKAKREAEEKAAAEAKAAQEKADREKRELAEKAERERKEAAEREERERQAREDAERRAQAEKEAREKAEADRKAAAEKAEREKKEAADRAAQAERDRIAAEEKRRADEAAAREADEKHRGEVNRNALADMMQHANLSEEQGKAIIVAIAKGLIRNTKINY